jgi:hypothetical protein
MVSADRKTQEAVSLTTGGAVVSTVLKVGTSSLTWVICPKAGLVTFEVCHLAVFAASNVTGVTSLLSVAKCDLNTSLESVVVNYSQSVLSCIY